MFVVLGVWLTLALAGWTILFSAADGAVRDATTGAPAGFVARVYFASYTMFTLGNGEYRPGSGTWQLATAAAAGTVLVLVLVTLALTYLVPVAAAVARRRQWRPTSRPSVTRPTESSSRPGRTRASTASACTSPH